MPQRGDTMLIPGDNGVPHLFIIIWGPGPVPNEGTAGRDVMVLVSLSSISQLYPHDPACELQAGDHPFVTHASYAVYRKIKCHEPAYIDSMVASGAWPAREPASRQLMHRLITGICQSRVVKQKFQHLLGCTPPPRTP